MGRASELDPEGKRRVRDGNCSTRVAKAAVVAVLLGALAALVGLENLHSIYRGEIQLGQLSPAAARALSQDSWQPRGPRREGHESGGPRGVTPQVGPAQAHAQEQEQAAAAAVAVAQAAQAHTAEEAAALEEQVSVLQEQVKHLKQQQELEGIEQREWRLQQEAAGILPIEHPASSAARVQEDQQQRRFAEEQRMLVAEAAQEAAAQRISHKVSARHVKEQMQQIDQQMKQIDEELQQPWLPLDLPPRGPPAPLPEENLQVVQMLQEVQHQMDAAERREAQVAAEIASVTNSEHKLLASSTKEDVQQSRVEVRDRLARMYLSGIHPMAGKLGATLGGSNPEQLEQIALVEPNLPPAPSEAEVRGFDLQPLRLVRMEHVTNARCLDGSAGGFYQRLGSKAVAARQDHQPIRVAVHLESGGWCSSAADCARWAASGLGSSRMWPDELQVDPLRRGGLLSQLPQVNPLLANADHFLLKYCDGGSYAGAKGETLVLTAEERTPGGVNELHLEGAALLREGITAMLQASIAHHELPQLARSRGCSALPRLELLLVAPGSAAVGVAAQAERILQELRRRLHYELGCKSAEELVLRGAMVLEEGVLVPSATYNREPRLFYPQLWEQVYHLHNLQQATSLACLQGLRDLRAGWRCFMEGTLALAQSEQHTVPAFIVASTYSSWGLANVLQLPCLGNLTLCSPDEVEAVQSYREDTLLALHAITEARPSDALFAQSCLLDPDYPQIHHDKAWMQATIGPDVLRPTFTKWYSDRMGQGDIEVEQKVMVMDKCCPPSLLAAAASLSRMQKLITFENCEYPCKPAHCPARLVPGCTTNEVYPGSFSCRKEIVQEQPAYNYAIELLKLKLGDDQDLE